DLAVAVLGPSGERIAANEAYAELSPPENAIGPLLMEPALAAGRAVKRVVEIDGLRWRAGLARVVSAEGPVDLLILGPAGQAAAAAPTAPELAEPAPPVAAAARAEPPLAAEAV